MREKRSLRLFGCILFVLFSMVFTFILISAPAPLPAQTPQALPKTLSLGTNPVGSLYYAMGAGLAKVIGAHTPMKVSVLPQEATVWYPLLKTGEVNFGINGAADVSIAYAGKAIYERVTQGKGYRELRTIMHGSPMMMSIVVRADSGIKIGRDLKGKRVVTDFGAHFSATLNQPCMLANFGLTLGDVMQVKASGHVDGVRALIEGRADASIQSIGSAVIEELGASPGGAYTLPLDPSPEAVERMRHHPVYGVHIPEFYVAMCKAGPAGIKEDKNVFAYPITMVCSESLSKEIVYRIAKAIWENYKELAPIHPQLKYWTPDRYASINSSVPYHDGAVRWYKEVGVWTEDLEKHQKKLLEGK